MSLVKIRGSQIQNGTLTDAHVASNAAIAESKLNINWGSHAPDILQQKKVVDYVQVNKKSVSGSTFDVTAAGVIISTEARTTSAGTELGVITDSPKNKVPLRDSTTGNPVVAVIGGLSYEVFGRVEWDGTNSRFLLNFYTASGVSGADAAYAFASATEIDFQYLKRFTLDSVSEMFAANEKFVDGAADASAHQNLVQLKLDLYGGSGTLDRDGQANLATPIVTQIANEITARQNADSTLQANLESETQGVTNTSVKAKTIIDEVVAARGGTANLKTYIDNRSTGGINTTVTASTIIDEIVAARGGQTNLDARLDGFDTAIANEVTARTNADAAIRNDLAATVAGKGATLIGIVDAGSKITATTVEGALTEIVDGYQAADSAIRMDLSTAGTAAKGANLIGIQDSGNKITATTVEGALEEILDGYKAADTTIKNDLASTTVGQGAATVGVSTIANLTATTVQAALVEHQGDIDTINSALDAAKGSMASVDARLDVSINEDGTLKRAADIHKHHKSVVQAVGGESIINLPVGAPVFVVGDDSLSVYVNGLLQSKGLHYVEKVDGSGVDFSPEQLLAGDVVVFMYHKVA